MNKMAMIAEQDLFDACHVLFGRQVEVGSGFLQYLQPSGVKSAYRSKARETHPDIMSGKGDFVQRRSAELFHQVQQAYESLNSYLDARERGVRLKSRRSAPQPTPGTYAAKQGRPAPPHGNGATRTRGRSRRRQQGAAQQNTPSKQIPARKLLFGHYLFYCGVTNWQTIIKALVWQRTERPRLGEIGKRFGWLTNADITNILLARKLSRSFGRSAVDMGLLTDSQLRLMVFQQNRLQKKIGEYFINNNILSQSQLNHLVGQCRSHNLAFSSIRQAS
ncbi:MAG: J domain-containing protein [Deltaproteobacteria bacterium]|nr:J domain-containing protein [Deltaproteobacteria bacterium]